jgi:hypothetical protein
VGAVLAGADLVQAAADEGPADPSDGEPGFTDGHDIANRQFPGKFTGVACTSACSERYRLTCRQGAGEVPCRAGPVIEPDRPQVAVLTPKARSQDPVIVSSASASSTCSKVRIRFSLGAAIALRSGCRRPPSTASSSCGRSAAWSPILRKLYAPAVTQTTATASTNTSVNRRPAVPCGGVQVNVIDTIIGV